jgi:hypothetical protein
MLPWLHAASGLDSRQQRLGQQPAALALWKRHRLLSDSQRRFGVWKQGLLRRCVIELLQDLSVTAGELAIAVHHPALLSGFIRSLLCGSSLLNIPYSDHRVPGFSGWQKLGVFWSAT